jgi:hypothetical protein
MQLPDIQTRQYIYRVGLAAIPLLLLAGFIAPDDVEKWLQLLAAVLGLGTTTQAALALRGQVQTGEVSGRHAKPES